jgi:hypothetical protein
MNHIHRYIRKKLGKSVIYKCNLKGCTHFIQKELAEGRNCICNRCSNSFIITKETLKNCPAKPHCENCYKRPSKEKILDELIETLVGE